jgi:hypothetical protein
VRLNKRFFLWILLLVAIILIFFLIYELTTIQKDMTDFRVCYQGGRRILAVETLYRAADGHLLYKYSPVSALFFSIFALLPYEVAKVLWFYLELAFLFGIFSISLKILPIKNKRTASLVVFSLFVLAKFIGRELELGQVNTLIIFLLTGTFAFFFEEKDLTAGIFYGVSLFFKPYALILVPYFLIKKKFRLLAAGLGAFLLGLMLPAVIYGPKGNFLVLQEWVETLFSSTPGLLTAGDNASLYAFLFKHLYGEQRWLAEILIVLGVGLLGAAFIRMMNIGQKAKLERPEILEASFLFILIPLLSPLGWYYNYFYSALAVLVLINDLDKFRPVMKYLLIANFIIIGGSLREILGKSIFRYYTHHSLVVINYLAVLFFLYYARRRKYS